MSKNNMLLKVSYRALATLIILAMVMCSGMMTAFATPGNLPFEHTESVSFTAKQQTREYTLTLDRPGVVRLELTHNYSGNDSFISGEIRTAAGELCQSFAVPAAEKVFVTPGLGLPSGNYAVRLTCVASGGGVCTLKASIGDISFWENEFNDTAASANALSVGSSKSGALTCIDDVDYFSFTAASSDVLSLNFAGGGANGIWSIALYGSENSRIAVESCTAGDTVKLTVSGHDRYYVCIKPMKYASAEYTVSLTEGGRSIRLGGETRIQTAIAISREGWDRADTVIVANAFNFPDALVGAPLANAVSGPILLTANGSGAEFSLLQEIDRLGATSIYILGGTAVVSPAVEKSLASLARVKRLAGSDRFGTAVAVAEELATIGHAPTAYFFAGASNFPDALSISPVAAIEGNPILYISPTGTLDSTTSAFIVRYGRQEAIILGGTAAVSANGESSIRSAVGTVKRISGTDRYDTAQKIYTDFRTVFTGSDAAVATGTGFPDALAGAAFAASKGMPVLLVSDSTASSLSAVTAGKRTLYIYGGTNAVSEGAVRRLGF